MPGDGQPGPVHQPGADGVAQVDRREFRIKLPMSRSSRASASPVSVLAAGDASVCRARSGASAGAGRSLNRHRAGG